MARIEKIELRKFRGATDRAELTPDSSKPILLLFGENGTGKSSFVDGLDCAMNGAIGSLESVSTDGQPKARFLISQGADPKSTGARVVIDGQTYTGTTDGRAVRSAGPEPRPAVRILRRRELVRLVEATPKERYDRLAPLLGINAVAASARRPSRLWSSASTTKKSKLPPN